MGMSAMTGLSGAAGRGHWLELARRLFGSHADLSGQV